MSLRLARWPLPFHRRSLNRSSSVPLWLCAAVLGCVFLRPVLPVLAEVNVETVAQQGGGGAFQAVPEAILKLHEEASAADDRGEWQKALALQHEVMTWVKANLPAVHPFRAGALNNLGIYLSKLGQRSEALPPTLEAVKTFRELSKTNPAFLPDLAMALNNLGNCYSNQIGRAHV